MPPVVKAQSLNLWTAREVPGHLQGREQPSTLTEGGLVTVDGPQGTGQGVARRIQGAGALTVPGEVGAPCGPGCFTHLILPKVQGFPILFTP